MFNDENKVKRKIKLKHIEIKQKEVTLPKEVLEKAEQEEMKKEEPELSADQQAILFICLRGHQSFISILQGVNSTRIPIGKPPLKEVKVRSLLDELEAQGYISKVEIHDQPAWTATAKARALET